jgi:1,4-dihydroxy-2-naphthoate octaprenyltransferase
MRRWLVWSLRIRRVEYRLAEVPLFLIPVLLTAPDASAFAGAPFWEGALVFVLMFSVGDLLNCVSDRDLDAVYKPHLSEAVYGLGVRGVWTQAVLSAALALAVAAHLAWLLGHWQLLAATAAGLVVAAAYSVEPVRLKGRGLWQPAFFWLGLFGGTMLFATLLFVPVPGPAVCAACLSYAMMQTGVVLVNTAEDFPEDRTMGVRTVIVSLGLRRGLGLALVLAVTGLAALLASFVVLYSGRALLPGAFLALLPLAIAGAAIAVVIARIHARTWAPEAEAVAAVRRGGRWVPAWITTLAACTLLAAAVYFAGNALREGA